MKQLFLLSIIILFFCMSIAYTHPDVDVVIPCHQKDVRTLDLAIESIKKYGTSVRRIIVVSAQKLTDKAEWFDEALYPFTAHDVVLAIFHGNEKQAAGLKNYSWVYQQLLKLYAPLVIPGISPNVFILDADTIFLNDVSFFNEYGQPLYNVTNEYHVQYFEHARRLLPGFKRVFKNYFGVCHCMLFQQSVIKDFFDKIEQYQQTLPWRALCNTINRFSINCCCMSEYELYFNFVFAGDYNAQINPLKWKNLYFDLDAIATCQQQGYHYVSCHSWMKPPPS